ncbi:MAG: hypothetical protein EBU75_05545 [Betaproteobacteria bacterium]|nr:hypothetical protein [Betaproteobacteria bacterium]
MNTAYLRAESVEQAIGWLQRHPQSRLLAGGQSLLPMLRWGLGEASHLIDLQDIGQLRSIENAENDLWIGAMVTHAEIARHPLMREILPFFAQVAAQIADAQVREVGTIGGSIAHHDPAACWPAAVLAGQAVLVTSEREIAADDFFPALFATSLRRDEILLGIRMRHGVRGAYRKHEHPASRFAMPGVALARMPEGAIRIAVTGLGQGVVRWQEAEQALAGCFSQHALDDLDLLAHHAESDVHASAEYRCYLARVLCRRLVASLAGEDPEPLLPKRSAALGLPPSALPPALTSTTSLDSTFRIQGEALLTASPDVIWQAVLKSEVLKACIPGCDQIQEVAPLRYEAQVRVGLGPIAARFASQVRLTVIEPVSASRAAHFILQAEGDAGRLGQAQAKIDIHLHPMAQGTRLTWSALPQLQGQLAQVGQRLTQISAKRLSEEFFIRLSALLGGEPLVSVRRPRWSRLTHAFRRWWHRHIGKKGEPR